MPTAQKFQKLKTANKEGCYLASGSDFGHLGACPRATLTAISSLLKEQRSRTGQKTEGAGALLSYTKSFAHPRLAHSHASTPKSNSMSANVGEENEETLKMQQEHSHKMAHAEFHALCKDQVENGFEKKRENRTKTKK